MEYDYARINLAKTNYQVLSKNQFKILSQWDYNELIQIYSKYCSYKKFTSVLPLWYEDFASENTKVFGYYDNNKLVAWSLMLEYPSAKCVTAEQFAWDYENRSLRLGISSLKSECAYYKDMGYHYLYLHGAEEYKKDFDGFEIVGAYNA